jgi:uncharacterized FAD-dependent dehydrogenase
MAIKVSNLRLGLDEPEELLGERAAQRLGVRPSDLVRWRILRKSLDARQHGEIHFVYAAELELAADEAAIVARSRDREIAIYHDEPFSVPRSGERPLDHPPVIIGSGPAGLFAAWLLAHRGYAPVVIERGKRVRERSRDIRRFEAGGELDPESNYLFGEGGAGTFSDGKLTSRAGGPDVQEVLRILAECKGKPSIVYEHRPHLGSNRLPAVIKAIRQRLVAAGAEFRFDCRMEDLEISDGRVGGVHTSSGFIPAEVVIVATGHSARDVYAMLQRRGVAMSAKPFQMGVRIEQMQDQIDRARYGRHAGNACLGAADYELVAHGPRDLFTFCMCAGGFVIPSVSEPGHYCTNGMSYSKHDSPFATSGLVTTLDPRDFGGDLMAGVEFQRRCEAAAFAIGRGSYAAPIQWADDFLAGRPSYGDLPSSHRRGTVPTNLHDWMPPPVLDALTHGLPILDRRCRGLFVRAATLVAPETRGSSPIRVLRDAATLESPSAASLYPTGEGAGYAGGIISAAVDGFRVAKAIIARFAPLGSTNNPLE